MPRKPSPTPPETVEASRLDRLIEIRDDLRVSYLGCEQMREKSALAREYRAVMAEIDQLKPVEQKGDAVDEIARRRAARRSGSSSGAARSKSS